MEFFDGWFFAADSSVDLAAVIGLDAFGRLTQCVFGKTFRYKRYAPSDTVKERSSPPQDMRSCR